MNAEEIYATALESLKNGDTGKALDLLEQAVGLERKPLYCSTLGVILARERRDFKKAVSLCKEAIKKEPKNSVHFLNLGRVHILANHKKEAIRIFYMGLRYSENREIIAELNRIGRRRRPVLPFLERSNPLNKILGKIFYTQRGRAS
jgi:predicted Zn-dependent protease